MHVPENLKYTKTHEWVLFVDDTTARVGLTDFAQHSLGDLVFVSLPVEGDPVQAGDSLGDVESVKAVSEVVSPVTGTVAKTNETLLDAPGSINEDPYGSWVVEISGVTARGELLDAAAYEVLCKEEE